MKLSELHVLIRNLCTQGYGQLDVKLGNLHKLSGKIDTTESITIGSGGRIKRSGTINFGLDYIDMEERAGKTVE